MVKPTKRRTIKILLSACCMIAILVGTNYGVYQISRHQSFAEGYSKGQKYGLDRGRQKGYKAGQIAGYNQGFNDASKQDTPLNSLFQQPTQTSTSLHCDTTTYGIYNQFSSTNCN